MIMTMINRSLLPRSSKSRCQPSGAERGSALVVVMLSMMILALAAAYVLNLTMQKAQAPTHAISWRYALAGAEAGIQNARMSLLTAATDPTTAWSDWTPSVAATWPKSKTFTLTPTASDSERALSTKITVTIDAPVTLNPVGSGSPWYRVRATGTANLPATARIGSEALDLALRQMNFIKTPTNPSPRVSRTVETLFKPSTPFGLAMLANDKVELKKGKGMVVDSYNSLGANPYVGTKYDVTKAGDGGNIATNSTGGKKGTDKVIRLEEVTVNGAIYKAGGVVETKKNVVVANGIVDGFGQEIKPPIIPDTTTYSYQGSLKPGDAKKGLTFTASAAPGGAKYSFQEFHLHDKADTITIKNPKSGVPAYIDIYVSDKFKLHGGATIKVDPAVYVNLYVAKDVKIEQVGGNGGIDNGTDRAEFLQIFGVVSASDAASGKTKKRKFDIKGSLTAAIYAPTYEFKIKPKKGGADFYGSMVGRKFKVEGEQRLHYDEALSSTGPVNGYSIVSWIEDWTPKGKLAKAP